MIKIDQSLNNDVWRQEVERDRGMRKDNEAYRKLVAKQICTSHGGIDIKKYISEEEGRVAEG